MCGLSLSGCGTFSDAMCGPINDHVFYRGVRLDVQAVKEGGPMVLMAADIPFSAVADTLCVPVLLPCLAYRDLTSPLRKGQQPTNDEQAIGDKCQAEPLPEPTPKQ
jgi:uncharacterized protein YceK